MKLVSYKNCWQQKASCPPPLNGKMLPSLTLTLLSDLFSVCQLAPDASIPPIQGGFFALVRTEDELSLVCRHDTAPETAKRQDGWCCLRFEGPFDFSLTGILVAVAAPLAQAKISIFALSTFNTDYLLIPQAQWQDAAIVLTNAGHHIKISTPIEAPLPPDQTRG